jgi:hypothetical protein
MTLRYDTRSRVSTYTQSWVSNADPDFGVFESIATTLVSSAVSSVTFSSIPQTYKHLQIRVLGRTARVNTDATIAIQLNSDTGSTWSNHALKGDGSAVAASGGGGRTYDYTEVCLGAGSSASANIFGVGVTDILDYADTNKYKTIRTLSGNDKNGSGSVGLLSANWRNTNAITSIGFFDSSGANIATNTHFALYGIKG